MYGLRGLKFRQSIFRFPSCLFGSFMYKVDAPIERGGEGVNVINELRRWVILNINEVEETI